MIFAGFGGQGVLFSGKVVAYAGLLDNKEVTWLPSYGPEMRGGTANCSVCVSDKQIGSPVVSAPNVLVVMNGPSFDKYIDTVIPGGKAFADSTFVERECQRDDITLYRLSASQLSVDEGLEGLANMILLGKVLRETGFSTLELLGKALEKCVPKQKLHLVELNLRGIKLGMDQ
jgi:2-oxoglutarate ferredoxin oxidoreductase subunit gamma